MRGERDTNPPSFRPTNNATPGTPSTVRQNPLSYQRMHSNDSDKEIMTNGNTPTNNGGGTTTTTSSSGRVSD